MLLVLVVWKCFFWHCKYLPIRSAMNFYQVIPLPAPCACARTLSDTTPWCWNRQVFNQWLGHNSALWWPLESGWLGPWKWGCSTGFTGIKDMIPLKAKSLPKQRRGWNHPVAGDSELPLSGTETSRFCWQRWLVGGYFPYHILHIYPCIYIYTIIHIYIYIQYYMILYIGIHDLYDTTFLLDGDFWYFIIHQLICILIRTQ